MKGSPSPADPFPATVRPDEATFRAARAAPDGQDGGSRVSRAPRDYRAYGLWVRSPIALPFTPVPTPPAGGPDVTVRIGAVPEALPAFADRRPRWETTPGCFLRRAPGGARFLVTGGRDILVEPRGSSDHEVGLFLTGSVFGALLQQRGKATFHAGAVETRAGAVLFTGGSGSGKSSLLAALVERGYAMLADDVTVVEPDVGGRPVALSAFPRMKLWADTLDKLAWRDRARGKVREGQEGQEKYLVPVERFRHEPQAVRAVCVLESHRREEVEVGMAPTADAFGWLCKYTYRGKYLRGLGQQPAHFRIATALARRVPVVVVRRPAYPFALGALADRVEEWLGETARQGAAGGDRTRQRRPAPALHATTTHREDCFAARR